MRFINDDNFSIIQSLVGKEPHLKILIIPGAEVYKD
jgi:hypothetical protein